MPKDENVLDLDALVGDAPVIQYKSKTYKIDPSYEDMVKVTSKMTEQINSAQMRKLIAALIPTFPLDGMTNLQLFPVFLCVAKHLNKAMGIELPELKDILAEKAKPPFVKEKAPTGASRRWPVTNCPTRSGWPPI